MKITNLNLINKLNILEKYSEKKFPQKISYAIIRNLTLLTKEYELYNKQLGKIIDSFSDSIIKDENGHFQYGVNGLPLLDKSVENEFTEQVAELLNIEIDLDIYYVDAELFDYDDKNGLYDTMTAKEIFALQSTICKDE